jgi:hypothetical protein
VPFPGRILLSRRQQTRGQPCSSHSGRWLVYAQQKLEELGISPLLILVSSLPRDAQALDCDMYYPSGNRYQNSGFSYYYFCAGTVGGSCTHNHTTCSVCFHDGQCLCFNPIYHPREQWLKVPALGSLLARHRFTTPKGQYIYIYFDVWGTVGKNYIYWPQGIGNTCRGPAWEKTFRSNNNYMWPGRQLLAM